MARVATSCSQRCRIQRAAAPAAGRRCKACCSCCSGAFPGGTDSHLVCFEPRGRAIAAFNPRSSTLAPIVDVPLALLRGAGRRASASLSGGGFGANTPAPADRSTAGNCGAGFNEGNRCGSECRRTALQLLLLGLLFCLGEAHGATFVAVAILLACRLLAPRRIDNDRGGGGGATTSVSAVRQHTSKVPSSASLPILLAKGPSGWACIADKRRSSIEPGSVDIPTTSTLYCVEGIDTPRCGSAFV